MAKQYLDKEGLQIVADKVNEAREVGAGAMALAQEVSETSTIAFTGTFAQWNALSAGEKAKFAGHIVNITDDTSDIQNAVRNPDWTRVVDLTTHTFSTDAYIVPEDGIFIVCRLRPVSNDVTSTMFVNGNLFIQSKSPTTGNADVNSNTCIPVTKGDSITIDNPRVQDPVYFVPYKTEIVITEPMNYSTTEQFTGKYWIDGKKIYRQCWDLTLTSYSDSGNRRVHTSDVLKAGVTFISAIGGMYAALQNNSGTLVHTNWFPITNIVASTSMTENCNAGCGVSPSGDLTVSVTSITTLDWQEAYAKVWIEYTK